MDRTRLSDERIRAFVCPAGTAQAFLWDSQAPGLAVRATPTAKAGDKRRKVFVFQSRYQGKPLRLTIGDAQSWEIADARVKAREMQQCIDNGRDPRLVKAETVAADREKREAAERQTVTVAEAWAAYLADRKPRWGARHYADHETLTHAGGGTKKRGKGATKAGPLAELMELRLSDLDAERLEAWAEREAASRPARARLGLRLVKAFIAWCATHKDYRATVKQDAAKSKRVREKLGDAQRRNQVLQKDQLAGWFTQVQQLSNPVMAAYLQFMLLCGPRPNEPLALKWTDLNFQWQTITLRDKIEGERVIGMTPYVAHLLAHLPRRNEWVFSSPASKGGRIVDASSAHDRACIAAGLPRISLQGLRRSFASLCEWIEVPAGISAQIQGHAPQGVREQNYIRRPVDLLRQWHERIEAWMLEHAGVKFTPQPHSLRVVAA